MFLDVPGGPEGTGRVAERWASRCHLLLSENSGHTFKIIPSRCRVVRVLSRGGRGGAPGVSRLLSLDVC